MPWSQWQATTPHLCPSPAAVPSSGILQSLLKILQNSCDLTHEYLLSVGGQYARGRNNWLHRQPVLDASAAPLGFPYLHHMHTLDALVSPAHWWAQARQLAKASWVGNDGLPDGAPNVVVSILLRSEEQSLSAIHRQFVQQCKRLTGRCSRPLLEGITAPHILPHLGCMLERNQCNLPCKMYPAHVEECPGHWTLTLIHLAWAELSATAHDYML